MAGTWQPKTTPLPSHKVCTQCRTKKPILAFGLKFAGKPERRAVCKECAKVISARTPKPVTPESERLKVDPDAVAALEGAWRPKEAA